MFARVDIDIVYIRRDLYYSRVRASPRDIPETARNWMAPRGAVRRGGGQGWQRGETAALHKHNPSVLRATKLSRQTEKRLMNIY